MSESLWPADTNFSPALLSRLYHVLRTEAVGRANAITSGELAERITGEDTAANPKTREAVLEVMRATQTPVVGCSQGYFVPQSAGEVEAALETLAQRRQGIERRERLLQRAWRHGGQPVRADGGAEPEDVLDDEELERIRADPVLEPEDVVEQRGEN